MTIDLSQFHDAFYEESFEALGSMEEALLGLDSGSPDPEQINTIFRVAHSIKGGAATFGFNEIASFTHTLETLLDELRAQRMHVTAGLTDLLLKSVDVMRDMLRAQQHRQGIDSQRVADLQFDLELAVARKVAPATRAPAVTQPQSAAPDRGAGSSGESAEVAGKGFEISFRPYLHLMARGNDPLRMFNELRQLGELGVCADVGNIPEAANLDPESCYLAWSLRLLTDATQAAVADVFDWAEGDCELVIRELAAPAAAATGTTSVVAAVVSGANAPTAESSAQAQGARAHNEAKPGKSAAASQPQEPRASDATSIRVSIEKIDDLMNSVGELVITQSMLGQFGALLEGASGERLRSGLAQLERNVRELQESVMRVRMVPISFVFSRFPRMVRDLSQRLNKQVELKMTGGETELDKTVLEKIGDPLVHLVRNCVDHGIEMPEVRKAAGKNPQGTVHLHAYHRGSSITVEVSDDGGGLKRERILAKARERGLIGADDRLSDEEVCNIIFMAGFSTADQATDISGRGVGMDVVRRNVEELGGSIDLRSEEGKGSRFIITLPLTLAIVDGQTVAVGEESYIVPLTAIVESLQVRSASISKIVGRGEVLSFRGDYLPIIRLDQVFRSSRRTRGDDEGLVMVVEGDGRRVGLCVDDLLGQQQVVVKTLEANYGHVDGIAGATILGDGSVALILDVAGLTRAATSRIAA
ncbi:MAG: chemotaxis protein CheA [Steroidobacteraceae bacterium]